MSCYMKKMGLTNPFKVSLFDSLLPYALYALLPIAIISLYFLPPPFITSQIKLPFSTPIGSPSPPSSSSSVVKNAYQNPCDYSNGKWVPDSRGPLYNGTTKNCKMKKTQNCISNGRPNTEYLYWRWKPNECNLPRFDPHTFVQLVKNKHVAFVGDSVARNQVESLICMLSTSNSSKPKRVYHQGSRRWNILSHNANLSFYWSPFLVQGVKRSEKGPNNYNTIYLDLVNERWAKDMDEVDLMVLSLGHWFDVPSVYYEGGSVLGCLNCPELNCTSMDFYGPLRKALRVALNSIIERKVEKGNKRVDVIVRTYSPSHFQGDWDKGGTCSKDKPYGEWEKKVEGKDAEIRRIELEEVAIAKEKGKRFGGFRLEVMDVTKLALLRPDGHPGAYMNPFPFTNGVSEHVQNDCVHWCLPGPIDTWNEIFLEMIKKFVEQPRSKG